MLQWFSDEVSCPLGGRTVVFYRVFYSIPTHVFRIIIFTGEFLAGPEQFVNFLIELN